MRPFEFGSFFYSFAVRPPVPDFGDDRYNKTLRRFERKYGKDRDYAIDMLRFRRPLCNKYSWSIPCDAALERIKGLGRPVVDMMAGTGYWASLLAAKGSMSKRSTLTLCLALRTHGMSKPSLGLISLSAW